VRKKSLFGGRGGRESCLEQLKKGKRHRNGEKKKRPPHKKHLRMCAGFLRRPVGVPRPGGRKNLTKELQMHKAPRTKRCENRPFLQATHYNTPRSNEGHLRWRKRFTPKKGELDHAQRIQKGKGTEGGTFRGPRPKKKIPRTPPLWGKKKRNNNWYLKIRPGNQLQCRFANS